MIEKRTKATAMQVQEKIVPFVTKHLHGRDTIDTKHIQQIAGMLLNQYNNVSITQGLEQGKDGKPWLKITVKSFLYSKEIILEVTGTQKE